MVVKDSRPSHRQRQAQATRTQIATTARALFVEHGYVATTITAIADAADIPVPTIYKAFGNKRAILDEIFEQWILDSGTQRDLADALTRSDPAERLRMAAHWQRREFEIGLDIIMIYKEAARADPQIADALHHNLAGRERALRRLIDTMEAHLAPGLSTGLALDVLIACMLAETYRTLVQERGWSPEQYEHWLAAQLIDQLLPR